MQDRTHVLVFTELLAGGNLHDAIHTHRNPRVRWEQVRWERLQRSTSCES
jgi:hypothetical protein